MQEDNVYPRRSTVQALPPDQAEAVADERIAVLSQFSAIEKTIAALTEQAERYESVHAIADEFLTRPTELAHVIAANKLTAVQLRAEAARLEELVQEHVKTR